VKTCTPVLIKNPDPRRDVGVFIIKKYTKTVIIDKNIIILFM
jgi:hypothetical protein